MTRYKIHFVVLISIIYALIFAVVGLASKPLFAAEAKPKPIARVEIGNHVGRITRMSVDSTCTKLVTGSLDKTIRIWKLEWPEKTDKGQPPNEVKIKPAGILRMPIDEEKPFGNQGKVYSVAISPNGKLIAAGGWFPKNQEEKKWKLYVFDAITADLIYVADNIPNRILDIKFSDSGETLAASFHYNSSTKEKAGIIVWETEKWREIYRDQSYGGASYSISFVPDSETLLSLSYDKKIRRYDLSNSNKQDNPSWPNPQTEWIETAAGKGKPYYLAINKKKGLIAIGFTKERVIQLVDIKTLKALPYDKQPIVSDIEKKLFHVAWSNDGETLIAGGSHRYNGMYKLRRWKLDDIKNFTDDPVSEGTISNIYPCRKGFVFSSTQPEFGFFSENRINTKFQDKNRVIEMRQQFGSMRVSYNGSKVRLIIDRETNEAVIYDMLQGRLFDATSDMANLKPVKSRFKNPVYDKIKNWDGKQWNGRTTLTYRGEMLGRWPGTAVRDDEVSYSLSISKDEKHFVIGSVWRLRMYEVSNTNSNLCAATHCPKWEEPIPSIAWSVNITEDNRYVVVAYDDGTIRWHSLETGKILLSFYLHPANKKWIVWSPKGFFQSSVGGEKLMGWHINGSEKAAEFFQASTYRNEFRRPVLVKTIFEKVDFEAALKAVQNQGVEIKTLEEISTIRPPDVQIISVNGMSHADDKEHGFDNMKVRIKYKITDSANKGVSKILITSDGVEVRHDKSSGLSRSDGSSKVLVSTIYVRKRNTTISITPYSDTISGMKKSFDLKWTKTDSGDVKNVQLFGLVIGFNHYSVGSGFNILNGAVNDATSLRNSLINQKILSTSPFSKVNDIMILTDWDQNSIKCVDKNMIIDKFKKLKLQILKAGGGGNTNFEAVTVISYSGHGSSNNDGKFFIHPSQNNSEDQNSECANADDTEATKISGEELLKLLSDIPGKKVLFLDACKAGNTNVNFKRDIVSIMNQAEFGRIGQGAGTIIFAATGAGELSFECAVVKGDNSTKHGCFTAAVLEAMKLKNVGHASEPMSVVDTGELWNHIQNRTTELANEIGKNQFPTRVKSSDDLADFELFGLKN